MDNTVVDKMQAQLLQFNHFMLGAHTTLPGIVESFNKITNLVDVKPAIKLKIARPGESVSFLDLPVIKNVPICLAQSKQAGLHTTVPMNAGDECLLAFSERAIDEFVKNGGVCFPAEGNKEVAPRHHDMTDAVCIPGLFTLVSALSDWNQDAIEVRNTAGTVKLSIYDDRIEGKGPLNWIGDIAVTGKIEATGDIKAATISLKTHTHGDPQGGTTTAPIP